MFSNASEAWKNVLFNILEHGCEVKPRGSKTLEVLHGTTAFNMRYPAIFCPDRKLSYRFLGGEALWILSGSNSVSGISPYNKRIADFSDDGEKFFGAYGPHIDAQIPYVVNSLANDRDSRQAVLTIWRQNPEPTKDYPCTVAMTFNVRNGKLNCHVFMRSSDAWLGFVYDVFNFSMIAARICWLLNQQVDDIVKLGHLYWTASSSHLYEPHFEIAKDIVANDKIITKGFNPVPDAYIKDRFWWSNLVRSLEICRDNVTDEEPFWRIRP